MAAFCIVCCWRPDFLPPRCWNCTQCKNANASLFLHRLVEISLRGVLNCQSRHKDRPHVQLLEPTPWPWASSLGQAAGVEATAEMAFPLPLLQRCQRRARVDHGEAEQRGGGILHHLLETRVFASLLTALYTMQNANAYLFLHRIVEVSLTLAWMLTTIQ